MRFLFRRNNDNNGERQTGLLAINTEKNALGRVLWVSREAYAVISKGEIEMNVPALLDILSAALSHLNDSKQPLAKVLRKLERRIKSINAQFYLKVKQYFSKVYPILDFDFEKAAAHVPAIIYGNDKICAKYVAGDLDKLNTMCDAMKSYPAFLFGEFDRLSDKQFFDLMFGYYPRLYENDDLMGEMQHLFANDDRPVNAK